jgi:hypothetical protein
MSTQALISQIDSLLMDTNVPRNEKRLQLRRLAREYWKTVFPEFDTPMFDEIPAVEKERRWQIQREKKELACCANADAVLRVLDSLGTGDLLDWVR